MEEDHTVAKDATKPIYFYGVSLTYQLIAKHTTTKTIKNSKRSNKLYNIINWQTGKVFKVFIKTYKVVAGIIIKCILRKSVASKLRENKMAYNIINEMSIYNKNNITFSFINNLKNMPNGVRCFLVQWPSATITLRTWLHFSAAIKDSSRNWLWFFLLIARSSADTINLIITWQPSMETITHSLMNV